MHPTYQIPLPETLLTVHTTSLRSEETTSRLSRPDSHDFGILVAFSSLLKSRVPSGAA